MGHCGDPRCMEDNADMFFDPACKQELDGELGEVNNDNSIYELRDQVAIVTLINHINHYQCWIIRLPTKSHDQLNNEFLELLIYGSV